MAGDPRFRVIVSSTHQSEKVIQIDWTAVLFGSTPYSSSDASLALQDGCGAKAAAGEAPQQQLQQPGLEQQQGVAAAGQEHADPQVVDRIMQHNPALFPEIQQVR